MAMFGSSDLMAYLNNTCKYCTGFLHQLWQAPGKLTVHGNLTRKQSQGYDDCALGVRKQLVVSKQPHQGIASSATATLTSQTSFTTLGSTTVSSVRELHGQL
jgi:hypothetical protein